MCAIRPGFGLAKSSKNPTPENVKKTACKNCSRASHGILSQILPELAKIEAHAQRMIEEQRVQQKTE
jgi:hypothetical protein